MSILLSLLLIGAQTQAADRAGKFSLDIPADETVTAPAKPKAAGEETPKPEAQPVETKPDTAVDSSSAPTEAPAPPPTAAAPASRAHFSLDTPIVDLLADPRAKAVLDKDMPGLSDDENLSKFQALSLRRLAPLSGGQMTAELMGKLAYDLAALGGGAPPPVSRKGLPSGR
ncbi:hypothetical protein [Sphingomonas sp. S6]|jgi:hypothetical protein|uniref:hypothetical protein n=1 Tax=Sphingomonas sp. S6 TaxID=3368600 RepID=UPI000875616F|nr:hypothetical protein [uncultured Sphingomonas sp.]RTL21166.1 MAG: hypothetical protein EKK50_03710 [Sphingomonadaceae bacterium]